MSKKVGLIILDGWGYGNKDHADAIHKANTPFFDELVKNYSNSTLLTDGRHVGLPDGQMGNSEVGHLNIGAGRIVYQDLAKINKAIEDGSFYQETVLIEALEYAANNNKNIHLLGLVSDGGIHSHIDHLIALCKLIAQKPEINAFIHAFTDGRDTDPKSGSSYISQLESEISGTNSSIATVCGRYYAMDRDLRWERIKKAYDAIKFGIGTTTDQFSSAIENSYNQNITDEFIEPIISKSYGSSELLSEGDVVICFNFRTDRCRQITRALSQEDFPEFDMTKTSYHYLTMTNYDQTFKNVNVVYTKDNLHLTLGEVVSNHQLSQIRIAETEKYPHVTFFFSGGREAPFEGEQRIMIPSPKVATYDLKPEMSAIELSDKILLEIEKESAEFICLNFANPDMVGHTGVFEAIIKAVETVDQQLEKIVNLGLAHNYEFVVIADHGNADMAINSDGSPNTAHTTNPVPVILVSPDKTKQLTEGILADVAPTILELLNLDIPQEMSGKSLLK